MIKQFQTRRISAIYDNNLMRVHKKFDEVYTGLINKKNYFVLNSHYQQNKYKIGSGIIKFYKNLIFGYKTEFKKELEIGDLIIPIDYSSVNDSFNESIRNNIKKDFSSNFCKVEKILSDSIILSDGNCEKKFNYKGDYLIKKIFYKYPSSIIFENQGLYKLFDKNVKNLIFNTNDFKYEENFHKDSENYFAPLDIDVPEVLNFDKKFKYYYDNHFFFHYGFIVKNLGNCVFRFKIEKM